MMMKRPPFYGRQLGAPFFPDATSHTRAFPASFFCSARAWGRVNKMYVRRVLRYGVKCMCGVRLETLSKNLNVYWHEMIFCHLHALLLCVFRSNFVSARGYVNPQPPAKAPRGRRREGFSQFTRKPLSDHCDEVKLEPWWVPRWVFFEMNKLKSRIRLAFFATFIAEANLVPFSGNWRK